jgi:hypothetical protein
VDWELNFKIPIKLLVDAYNAVHEPDMTYCWFTQKYNLRFFYSTSASNTNPLQKDWMGDLCGQSDGYSPDQPLCFGDEVCLGCTYMFSPLTYYEYVGPYTVVNFAHVLTDKRASGSTDYYFDVVPEVGFTDCGNATLYVDDNKNGIHEANEITTIIRSDSTGSISAAQSVAAGAELYVVLEAISTDNDICKYDVFVADSTDGDGVLDDEDDFQANDDLEASDKSSVVINEIMYNPVSGDPQWFEITNTDQWYSTNLTGWQFSDGDGNTYTITGNSTTVNGDQTGVSNILVNNSSGFSVGDKVTIGSTIYTVTAVPDGTHITIDTTVTVTDGTTITKNIIMPPYGTCGYDEARVILVVGSGTDDTSFSGDCLVKLYTGNDGVGTNDSPWFETTDDLSLLASGGAIQDYVAWGGDPGTGDDNAVAAQIWPDGGIYVPDDTAVGHSLARVRDSSLRDGYDTNDYSDWYEAYAPSPGEENTPSIVINEIELRETVDTSVQWAELYVVDDGVAGDSGVDISRYMLTDLSGTDTAFAGSTTTVSTGDYVIIHFNSSTADETDAYCSTTDCDDYIDLYVADGLPSIAADGQLVLRSGYSNSSGIIINEVMSYPSSGNDWIELYIGSDWDFSTAGNDFVIQYWNGSAVTTQAITTGSYKAGTYLQVSLTAGMSDTSGWVRICRDFVNDTSCSSAAEYTDFMAYGASPTTYDTDAVSAGIWVDNNYVTGTVTQGNTLGRDQFETDTNKTGDWEITNGKDASSSTANLKNLTTAQILDSVFWDNDGAAGGSGNEDGTSGSTYSLNGLDVPMWNVNDNAIDLNTGTYLTSSTTMGRDANSTDTDSGNNTTATTLSADASGTSLTVTSSTGFYVGQTITVYGSSSTTAVITAIPDGTHLTVNTSVSAASGSAVKAVYDWADTGGKDSVSKTTGNKNVSAIINEVMFDPASGNDWVEIYCGSDLTSQSYTLDWGLNNDGAATRHTISLTCSAGQYVRVEIPVGSYSITSGLDTEDSISLCTGASCSTAAIVDFVAYGEAPGFTLTSSPAYYAVQAGIWTAGTTADYVPTSGISQGETIGRDKDQTDTNVSGDWAMHGGKDAIGPTPAAVCSTQTCSAGTSGQNVGSAVVLNEIMFNSGTCPSSYEWIELYNPGTTTQDIYGHTITIAAGGYSYSIPDDPTDTTYAPGDGTGQAAFNLPAGGYMLIYFDDQAAANTYEWDGTSPIVLHADLRSGSSDCASMSDTTDAISLCSGGPETTVRTAGTGVSVVQVVSSTGFTVGQKVRIKGVDYTISAIDASNAPSITIGTSTVTVAVGDVVYGLGCTTSNIYDFIQWGTSGTPPTSTWDDNASDGTGTAIWTGGTYYTSGSVASGETIGRDKYSTDLNTIGDWSDHGGSDAAGITPGEANIGSIIMNEISYNSDGTITGNMSKDWIEFYNPTDLPLNIDNYCISFNDGTTCAYVIPDIEAIPSGEYLIVRFEETGTNDIKWSDGDIAVLYANSTYSTTLSKAASATSTLDVVNSSGFYVGQSVTIGATTTTVTDINSKSQITVADTVTASSGATVSASAAYTTSGLGTADGISLYNNGDTRSSTYIVDFVAYGISAPASSSNGDDAYDAVQAGLWGSTDYFNTSVISTNETFGRDMNSSDTNASGDWADTGGKDAISETYGYQNYNTNPNTPTPEPDGPTYALISSFRVYADGGLVVVEWQTTAEVGTIGFNLYRKDGTTGKFNPLNQEILPSNFLSQDGAAYSYADETAREGETYTYKLGEVTADDKEKPYGPFTVTVMDKPGASDPEIWTTKYMTKGHEVSADKKARNEAAKAAREAAKALKKNRSGKGVAKLEAVRPGIYQVTAQEAADLLGVPVSRAENLIRNAGLSLTHMGMDVPYHPADGNSGLYFYNPGIDSIYTDVNVFWLKIGSGVKMEVLTSAAQTPAKGKSKTPAPVPVTASGFETFLRKIHFEQNIFSGTDHVSDPESDYWFWTYIRTDNSRYLTQTLTANTPDPDNSGTAVLTLYLHGANNTDAIQDHHLTVSVNGTPVGEGYFDGKKPYTLDISFEQRLLNNGQNTIQFRAMKDTGSVRSIILINSFDISYQSFYRAEGDQLAFGGGNAAVQVEGFTAPNVMVLDVTRPGAPKWIPVEVTDQGGDYRISLKPKSDGLYFAAAGSAVSGVEAWPDEVSTLADTETGADYIVITPDELAEAAQALANYRSGSRLVTMVATLEDIMDEFNAGVYSPWAIRDFLTHALYHWSRPPVYVVLAGSGTFDYKNYIGAGDNLIPAVQVSTPYGLFGSDNRYADVAGDDGVPEIAIGRIPVMTGDELLDYVDKLIAYENAPDDGWSKNVIMLADDPDPDAGYFNEDSDTVAALVPAEYTAQKLYLTASHANISAVRTRFINGINNGAGYVNYIGHGSTLELATWKLFYNDDVDLLYNNEKLPIMTLMTCMTGRFSYPNRECLAEKLVRSTSGGAIAVWTATGLSDNSKAVFMDKEFFRLRFQEDEKNLGWTVVKTLESYGKTGGDRFMLDIYNLTGDPAIQMK